MYSSCLTVSRQLLSYLSLSLSFETLGSIEHVFGLVRLFFLLSTTSAPFLFAANPPTSPAKRKSEQRIVIVQLSRSGEYFLCPDRMHRPLCNEIRRQLEQPPEINRFKC